MNFAPAFAHLPLPRQTPSHQTPSRRLAKMGQIAPRSHLLTTAILAVLWSGVLLWRFA